VIERGPPICWQELEAFWTLSFQQGSVCLCRYSLFESRPSEGSVLAGKAGPLTTWKGFGNDISHKGTRLQNCTCRISFRPAVPLRLVYRLVP